jgi:hypothetical protein
MYETHILFPTHCFHKCCRFQDNQTKAQPHASPQLDAADSKIDNALPNVHGDLTVDNNEINLVIT